jgi:hypothetical protein
MGVAALISWFVTAFVGLYLVAVWLIENDDSEQGATRSRLHGSVIAAHVLLALGGLMVWVLYLVSDEDTVGWATLAILGGIAVLGLAMLTRWIPVHRAFVAAESARGVAAEFEFPAERAFPVAMVMGHGLLAFTTFTLVLLTVLGVRGS